MTTNYIIATFAGVLKTRTVYENVPRNTHCANILKDNLFIMANMIEKYGKLMDQITIMRASVPGKAYKDYYKIDDSIKRIQKKGVIVKIHDVKNDNRHVSYHQYTSAYRLYPNFDYYILCEEDYVPYWKNPNFIKEMINIFNQKIGKGGYLCTWCKPRKKLIADISNGILDNICLKTISDNYNLNSLIDGQIYFSYLVTDNNMVVTDYSEEGKKYSIYFWDNSKLVCFDKYNDGKDKYIFLPIQMLPKYKISKKLIS